MQQRILREQSTVARKQYRYWAKHHYFENIQFIGTCSLGNEFAKFTNVGATSLKCSWLYSIILAAKALAVIIA